MKKFSFKKIFATVLVLGTMATTLAVGAYSDQYFSFNLTTGQGESQCGQNNPKQSSAGYASINVGYISSVDSQHFVYLGVHDEDCSEITSKRKVTATGGFTLPYYPIPGIGADVHLHASTGYYSMSVNGLWTS